MRIQPQLVAAALLLLVSKASWASYIVKDVTVTASSYWTLADQSPQNLANGSGLSQPLYDLTPVDLPDTTHDFDASARRQWHTGNGNPTPWLVFKFDRPHDLKTVYVWNGNQNTVTSRGVAVFDILISTDGGITYHPTLTDQVLPRAPGSTHIRPKSFTLTGNNGVTHVRFEVKSNHGDAYTGLSEVMFVSQGESEQALIADSKRHFSPIQGNFGWSYGYYSVTFAPSGFREMRVFHDGGWAVDPLPPAPTYWTSVGVENTHPNGTTTTGSATPATHWAVRRWTSWISGKMRIEIFIRDFADDGNSNGQRFRFYHKNQLKKEQLLPAVFTNYQLSAVLHVESGDTLDFALDPVNGHDWADSVGIVIQVSLVGPDAKLFPELEISRNDFEVQVRWPKASKDLILQSNSDFIDQWNTISNGITDDGVFFIYKFILNDSNGSANYFRLATP